jgi:5'-methylthioadenosine phosphorylase
VLAVIGGSGVYGIEGLKNDRWIKAESSFGRPSDEFLMGEPGGETVVFLPRHGRGHRIPPTQINYRANIDTLKRLGVTDIVSVSAVGSRRRASIVPLPSRC